MSPSTYREWQWVHDDIHVQCDKRLPRNKESNNGISSDMIHSLKNNLSFSLNLQLRRIATLKINNYKI